VETAVHPQQPPTLPESLTKLTVIALPESDTKSTVRTNPSVENPVQQKQPLPPVSLALPESLTKSTEMTPITNPASSAETLTKSTITNPITKTTSSDTTFAQVGGCVPNPCQNGGSCRVDDWGRSYCTCPDRITGLNCETDNRQLQPFLESGSNLPDYDSIGVSDPYVEFIATKRDGTTVRKLSNVVDGNLNPVWNQNFNFGFNCVALKARIWDSDGFLNGDDDEMSGWTSLDLTTGSSEHEICAWFCNGIVKIRIIYW
jgi:hypothetical protein